MGIFDMLLAPRAVAGPNATDDFWYQPVPGVSSAGVRVTPDTALTVGAVFACVRILAETIAALPLLIYERLPGGGKQRATNHPLFFLLHDQPNAWQSSFEWREMSMGHLALRGNAYSRILPGPRGFVDQLVPLHPDRVTVLREPEGPQGRPGRILYQVRREDGTAFTLLPDEVFHVRGLSSDGVTGLSIVGLARETIGLAMAVESYGARFFSQNSTPRGVLKVDGKLSSEAKDRLRRQWQEAQAGLGNAHRVAVLEAGLEWQSIGLSNEDSQFLESRKFSVNDIARWFRIPPHMVGDLDRATFSNIEQQSLEFVVHTILPWLRRWEQAISRDLILARERFFAEFLVDGLLRGDVRSRFEAYRIGREIGVYSVNDILELENRNPIGPEGDTRLQPLNMAPLGATPARLPERGDRSARAFLIAQEFAARLVRREIKAVQRQAPRCASDPQAWRQFVTEFYDGFTGELVRDLHIPEGQARLYCERHRDALIEHGVAAMEAWEEIAPPVLADLALGEE